MSSGTSDCDRYRLPSLAGPEEPLPAELDTAAGWQARGRVVRPGCAAAGEVRTEAGWSLVFPVSATEPRPSGEDPDVSSAAPARADRPGVYTYAPYRSGS